MRKAALDMRDDIMFYTSFSRHRERWKQIITTHRRWAQPINKCPGRLHKLVCLVNRLWICATHTTRQLRQLILCCTTSFRTAIVTSCHDIGRARATYAKQCSADTFCHRYRSFFLFSNKGNFV